MADTIRPLDATDQTQIMIALQEWINGIDVLPEHLYLEYTDQLNTFCIKCNGGAITEEDICGNFSAEVQFSIYYYTNAEPDDAGEVPRPLNDLSAWFKKNGTPGLNIGDRRTIDKLTTLKIPTDLNGQDESGNVEFFSIFSLEYDEEAE